MDSLLSRMKIKIQNRINLSYQNRLANKHTKNGYKAKFLTKNWKSKQINRILIREINEMK